MTSAALLICGAGWAGGLLAILLFQPRPIDAGASDAAVIAVRGRAVTRHGIRARALGTRVVATRRGWWSVGTVIAAAGLLLAGAALPALALTDVAAGTAGESSIGGIAERVAGIVAALALGAAALLAGRRGSRSFDGHRAGAGERDRGTGLSATLLAGVAGAAAGMSGAQELGLGPDGTLALAAGLGLAVPAIPEALLGAPRVRPVGLAVAVAAVGLVARGLGTATVALAVVAPLTALAMLVAAAVVSGTHDGDVVPVRRGDGSQLDLDVDADTGSAGHGRTQALLATGDRSRRAGRAFGRVRGVSIPVEDLSAVVATLAGPVIVGLQAVLSLATATPASAGSTETATPERLAAVLTAFGGLGGAVLIGAGMASDTGRRAGRVRSSEAWFAAAIVVGAAALHAGWGVEAMLLVVVAGVLAAAGTAGAGPDARGDALERRSFRLVAFAASGAALAAGLAIDSARGDPAGEVSVGIVAIAIGLGVRTGSVPFHRLAIGAAIDAPVLGPAVAFGWLAAVATAVAAVGVTGTAAVGVTGTAAANAGGPDVLPTLGRGEALVVEAVAVATIVLAGIAAIVNRDLRRVVGYLVAASGGWLLVLLVAAGSVTVAEPASASEARSLPLATVRVLAAFVAGAMALAGVAILARREGDRWRIDDLPGILRAAPAAAIALLGAVVALVGVPGGPVWDARARLLHATIGELPASAVLAVTATLTVVAIGRIVVVGLRPGAPTAFESTARGTSALPTRLRVQGRARLRPRGAPSGDAAVRLGLDDVLVVAIGGFAVLVGLGVVR